MCAKNGEVMLWVQRGNQGKGIRTGWCSLETGGVTPFRWVRLAVELNYKRSLNT